jgi:hypothetical protein
MRGLRRALPILVAALAVGASAPAATITIVNADSPGEGFNDTTAATPVGGNTGTTVGQQRLIAFQRAADIWGAVLTTPVEIRIQSSFDELECSATSAVLGSAGPIQVFSDHANAPLTGTWYAVALANKQAGSDQAPPSQGGSDDIRARFNSRIGTSGCLASSGWYYGLDGNSGSNTSLVDVLLHEFGHGLGFLSLVNDNTGEVFFEQPDAWTYFLFDDATRRRWLDMSPTERRVSTTNFRRVTWLGPHVTAAAPAFLAAGSPTLRVNAPASLAGNLPVGTAIFGAALSTAGVTANVVLAQDPSDTIGPSTSDGCAAFTNAAAVAGRIALIDRGSCDFIIKVRNAQTAGAVGAIIANNQPTGVVDMSGTDNTVVIPAVSVSQVDGVTLRGPGISATILLDATRRMGTGDGGRVLVFTPSPVDPGSSVSHFDRSATPNLLMEPNINDDIDLELDLTLPLLEDIGWGATPDADADGVSDGLDNCVGIANPGQNDGNHNGVGDACEGLRIRTQRDRGHTTQVSPR